MCPYELLGVDPGSTPEEIKRGYIRARKSVTASQQTQIKNAYDMLRDPRQRAMYDAGAPRREPAFQPRGHSYRTKGGESQMDFARRLAKGPARQGKQGNSRKRRRTPFRTAIAKQQLDREARAEIASLRLEIASLRQATSCEPKATKLVKTAAPIELSGPIHNPSTRVAPVQDRVQLFQSYLRKRGVSVPAAKHIVSYLVKLDNADLEKVKFHVKSIGSLLSEQPQVRERLTDTDDDEALFTKALERAFPELARKRQQSLDCTAAEMLSVTGGKTAARKRAFSEGVATRLIEQAEAGTTIKTTRPASGIGYPIKATRSAASAAAKAKSKPADGDALDQVSFRIGLKTMKAIRHGSQQHDLKVEQAAIIDQILSLTPEEVASLSSPKLKQYWALRAAHTLPLTPYASGKWEYCPRVHFRLPGDTGRSAQRMDINNM